MLTGAHVRHFLGSSFFRFLWVGGINTLFGYLLFASFIFCGFKYPLAVLFTTILGTLFNFKTFGIIVFKDSDKRRFFRFFLLATLLYFLNIFFIKAAYFYYSNYYVAGAMAVLCITPINFFLNKKWVFRGGV